MLGQERNCNICLDSTPEVYSISRCQHRYCMGCCQRHIRQSVASFTPVMCPSGTGCNGNAVDQTCQPYLLLDDDTRRKYAQFKRFEYFQKNPTKKSCRAGDCQGQLNLRSSSPTCNLCHRAYCPRCVQFSHEGPCSEQQQLMMEGLGYKRCGQCRIFVEKVDGCKYISCTCGNHFCYSCGAPWSSDPCRLKQFVEKHQQIRTILKQTRLNKHCQSGLGFCRLVVLTTIQLFILPLWIFFAGLVLPTLVIGLTLTIYILFSPLALVFVLIAMPSWNRKQIVFVVLIIGLYPLVAALMLLMVIAFLVMYACVRDRFEYHHGIYDPFIELGLGYVIWFLNVNKSIVAM